MPSKYDLNPPFLTCKEFVQLRNEFFDGSKVDRLFLLAFFIMRERQEISGFSLLTESVISRHSCANSLQSKCWPSN
jgi:hypothetical protein